MGQSWAGGGGGGGYAAYLWRYVETLCSSREKLACAVLGGGGLCGCLVLWRCVEQLVAKLGNLVSSNCPRIVWDGGRWWAATWPSGAHKV